MVPLKHSSNLAITLLFQRLKWPVPMSRWRTAKEIRNLLNDPGMNSVTTEALLTYLDQCKTESEVCEVLTIIFLTSPACRPSWIAIASHIHCPSILADVILERSYGSGHRIGGWNQAHSGIAPVNFVGDHYFEEHKTSHVPPIFMINLKELESRSGYPLMKQWAYEWCILRDRLSTRYTSYPYYFDNSSDVRAGIIGQYWQRMREVYLSAYLRTLALAVNEWHMPESMAEDYCLEVVHGIAGLFDVDPTVRPAWLSNIPEKCCIADADLMVLVRELLQAAQVEGMRLVSLDTPIASSIREYANLTLSAHLVTPNYEWPNGTLLYENMPPLYSADTFELKGPLAKITTTQASTKGTAGDEISVCSCLFPIPRGTWQNDYFSMGVRVPASYIVANIEIRCTQESIDCIASDGKAISRTRVWHDDWMPRYPKNGSTRCGTTTLIDQDVLAEAMKRLNRRLAFFVHIRTWERAKAYGDYLESQRTFFFYD